MTTIYNRKHQGPAMHVLLIGVGAYPHCGPGGRDTGEGAGRQQGPVASTLKSVTTAEPSVMELAAWLLRTQSNDPVLPLGSLEVALSPKSGTPATIDGIEVKDRADLAGVTEAFTNWIGRSAGKDVTIFYFVGHGCALRNGQQALLLEDFGERAFNEFDGALDFLAFYEGMHRCAAQSQLFFLDCCRDVPSPLREQSSIGARPLITQDASPITRTTAHTIYATGRRQEASGERNGASPFSVALRDAFDGLAAKPGDDGVWRVQAQELANAIRGTIGFPHGVPDEMMPTAENEVRPDLMLRQLPGAPDVPFEITCAPWEASTEAQLLLKHADGSLIGPREPAPEPWIGRVRAGVYEVSARFGGQRWQDVESPGRWCFPPLAKLKVEVKSL